MATLTITTVSSQLGPLTEITSATLEGSCNNSSVFGTGCTIYAAAGSTNLGGYGVRGYFKISDAIPYTIPSSLITGIRIHYGYANISCLRGGTICTESSIGTLTTRSDTYIKVAITSTTTTPEGWGATYDIKSQEVLLTNNISGSLPGGYFHFEITGGSSTNYTYYIGSILRITSLEITYTDDPEVNGSAVTNQLWPAPDNTVTLKRATYPIDGFTLSGKWTIYKYDGDFAEPLGFYDGFEVTCGYLTTPGVYIIRSYIYTSGGTSILSKDVTVTISPLSETKTIAGEAVTDNTTISKKTGNTTTSYGITFNTTFLDKVDRLIYVNGVEVAYARSTSNLFYGLPTPSNATYTIRFVATTYTM